MAKEMGDFDGISGRVPLKAGEFLGCTHELDVRFEGSRSTLTVRYFRATLLTLLIIVGIGWQTGTQGEDTLHTPFSASGREVSFYFAAKNFLTTAVDALDAGRDAFDYTILRELKLEPGSRGALEVVRAAELTRLELANYIDLRPYVGDTQEYDRRQEEFQRNQARRITEIFNTMLVEVQASDGDPMAIINFIEEKIRPNVVLVSDKANFLTTERIFQVVDEEFFLITDDPGQPKQASRNED